MQNYRILSKKGEGTFSQVMRAVNIQTQKQVAIKCMKRTLDSMAEVNRLFEIQALRKLAGHPHIVQLHDVLFEDHRLAIVFELMDMNLYEAIKDRKMYLPESRVVKWMFQLLLAIDHMHKNELFHRDVKPENLLILGDVLKLADLGSCCPVNASQPFTEYISTRWYRAPECLLTSGYYSGKMDIWAVGCVFYELMTLNPLFPGKNELDTADKIHAVLGTPSEEVMTRFRKLSFDHLKDVEFPKVRGCGIARSLSHCSAELIGFLQDLLTYDPDRRLSASQSLTHPFFARFLHPPNKRSVSPASTSVELLSPRGAKIAPLGKKWPKGMPSFRSRSCHFPLLSERKAAARKPKVVPMFPASTRNPK